MNRLYQQKGFSLVELGVSLTIIAMVIAGVAAGVNLKNKLELNQVMEQVGHIGTALKTFKKTYNGYPGDMFDAEDKFGAADTNNGNGDFDLADTDETFLFWQHLSLAGLIEGNYNGTTDTKTSPLKNGVYTVTKTTSTGDIFISLQRTGANTGMLTNKQAWDIDTRFDDGIPTSGIIQAVDGAGETAGDCVNTTPTPDAYNLSNDDEEPCVMRFFIE